MNIRDLNYLLALSEHQHFGRAAQACFVSQPTLSMQIKKLEEALGVQLVERNNKRAIITPIGQSIVSKAKHILDDVEAIKALAAQASDPYSGRLTLGIIPTLAPYLLPRIMPEINQRFTALDVYLVELQTHHLLDALAQGRVDAAILALPIQADDLHTESLFHEDFYLAVAHGHPLSQQTCIDQKDLQDLSLLLLEEGHCLRDNALEICQMNHAATPQQFRATSLETLRQMVASHLGITLMPELAMRPDDHIHYLEFHPPKPQREIGIVWRQSSTQTAVLQALVSLIKQTQTHCL